MSPKNHVTLLNQACLNILVDEIVLLLNMTSETLITETLQAYINKSGTCIVITDILRKVLSSSAITSREKYLCLKSLLRSDVTELNCSNFSQTYHKMILNEIVTKNASGIQHLVLTNFAKEDCGSNLLVDALKALKYLRVLKIPNITDDDSLSVIQTMQHLYCLDISGDVNFSSKALSQFTSNSIQVLSIGETKKLPIEEFYLPSTQNVAVLVKNLPNLTVLQVYNFGGKALQKLQLQSEAVKTKLCYIRDKNSTQETIEALVKLCPNLESVELDNPTQGCVKCLKYCRNIGRLKLTAAIKDELVEFLKGCGKTVREINLERIHNVEFFNIVSCNTTVLKCTEMALNFTQRNLSIEIFRNLCDLELLSCDVPDYGLKVILSNSPRLRRFAIGGDIKLTDWDFVQICKANRLSSLEEFWLSNAKFLTAVTVKLLIDHCSNLQLIGQLSSWDIERDEINYLRFNAFVTNTRVQLLYFPSLTFRL